MLETSLTLCNKLGLHARASMKLIDTAMAYGCDIQVCFNGRCVNAKSIMEVMVLGASYQQEITIKTNGSDEETAMEAICNLINNRFGEAE